MSFFTSCRHVKIILKNVHTEAFKQNLGNAKPQLTLSRIVHFIKGTAMCSAASVQKCKKKEKKRKIQ